MFSRIVETIIQDAMRRGQFDGLAGTGGPIDLRAYFETPEELRLAYSLLDQAGMVPREVELLREIADLTDAISTSSTEDERRSIRKRIRELRLEWEERMARHRRERSRA